MLFPYSPRHGKSHGRENSGQRRDGRLSAAIHANHHAAVETVIDPNFDLVGAQNTSGQIAPYSY